VVHELAKAVEAAAMVMNPARTNLFIFLSLPMVRSEADGGIGVGAAVVLLMFVQRCLPIPP
jgi:hypothetical protein